MEIPLRRAQARRIARHTRHPGEEGFGTCTLRDAGEDPRVRADPQVPRKEALKPSADEAPKREAVGVETGDDPLVGDT
jgi:hypothetical protein